MFAGCDFGESASHCDLDELASSDQRDSAESQVVNSGFSSQSYGTFPVRRFSVYEKEPASLIRPLTAFGDLK